jgi:hypothetical protein
MAAAKIKTVFFHCIQDPQDVAYRLLTVPFNRDHFEA